MYTGKLIKKVFVNFFLYVQGFHDIAITLLLVVGEEESYNVLCQLSKSHFQLFMGPDMEPTMEILNLVYALVRNENHDLYNYLMRYKKESCTWR